LRIRLSFIAALSATASAVFGINHYTITDTDTDYSIAKKLGIKREVLYKLNPEINWNRLRPGKKVKYSDSGFSKTAQTVKKGPSTSPKISGNFYLATDRDTDYSIAKKHGLKLPELHNLNPNINWNRLRPGAKVVVTSSTSATRFEGKSSKMASVDSKKLSRGQCRINAEDVLLRSQPNRRGSKLSVLEKGLTGRVLASRSGWTKVKFPKSDLAGWVKSSMLEKARKDSSSKMVAYGKKSKRRTRRYESIIDDSAFEASPAIASASPKGKSVVDHARSCIGTRYRWSAMSRSSGFDCSGLTSYVYKKHGVSLPHKSSKQIHSGKVVMKSELKPGDLLFFKNRRGKRVNHVGIYAGNGKFIHASSSKHRVREDTLKHYGKTYVGARRVF
jgi:cell wall-associated NlpC family hydrolase